ncbi:hypothetical protein HGH93_21675 [Chitinophaga polysaccharea]|uniref:DUF7873 family protein n=1 Tax=Chitinophaga polysaccharea TaxID=1293035 RepID=UPI00145562EF|nr:hypothetical protein [Chitinophaga polysaccharea]NLR60735.1 hypothetical protein [Chitinophaga polysaccharea]
MILETLIRKTKQYEENISKEIYAISHSLNLGLLSFTGFKKVFGINGSSAPLLIQEKPVTGNISKLFENINSLIIPVINDKIDIGKTRYFQSEVYPIRVEGIFFGSFSLAELEMLQETIESKAFTYLYQTLPARKDEIKWTASDAENYVVSADLPLSSIEDQDFQPIQNSEITLDFSQVSDISRNYHQKDLVLIKFTEINGGMSQKVKDQILERLTSLKTAIREAIEEAKAVQVVASEPIGERILNFIHYGNDQGQEDYPF